MEEGDSQLRWIGPQKGAIHLATAAVVNAVWDLWGKDCGKPVWRIVSDLSPEEQVKLVDFSSITDAITPEEALEIFKAAEKGKDERVKEMLEVRPSLFMSTCFVQQVHCTRLSRSSKTSYGLFHVLGLLPKRRLAIPRMSQVPAGWGFPTMS